MARVRPRFRALATPVAGIRVLALRPAIASLPRMQLPLPLVAGWLATCLALAAAPSAWNYPATARGDVVDDYHGVKVPDPYRWLEDLDAPATKAWVDAQNRLTFGFLQQLPARAALRERLGQLWNYERYGLPFKENGRYFVSKNSGLQNQSVMLVQASLGGEARVLIDPNTLARDGTVALTVTDVSPDGRWLVYGTAAAGSDWNEYRVRAVDTAQDTTDHLRWIKFASPSWTRDSRGFFYSRYPAPAQEAGNAKTFSALENQQIYYHRLGTPQAEDRRIFGLPAEPRWFVRGVVSDDGRYLVISVSRGSSSENLVYLADLGDPQQPRLDAPVRPLIANWEAEYDFMGNVGGSLYFLTNREAPRKKVIAIEADRPAPANWRTLVPESAATIKDGMIAGERLVLHTMHDAASRLSLLALDGRPSGEIALPTLGSVNGMWGRPGDHEMFFNFTAYTYPTTNYRYDLARGELRVLHAPKVAFDPAAYETRQVFFPSRDGTRVPMFITHRKGLPLDGRAPTLLYGYGGFDISLTPSFSVPVLAWLEMGGIYAVPNLRGGGEYGKAWHDAGTKERKQNVFDDFIAAAEYLFAHHYTSRDHLVLSGGSNGGLLVGAVVNQRPDLCRVAWPAVGVMDMLRFHKFTIGYAWVSDYGSSDDPAGFKYLSAYSPLHTVRAGARYPAVLVTTADHDDRVHPAHSFKYTAALQSAVDNTPGALPVMIRIETRAGHGAGKPTSKLIEENADKLAFAAHFLGLALPAK